jgi:class 3 adenylate cyclase
MSESRVLAVLFADLVDSTRLLVELGDRGVELSKKLADRLAARTTERGGVVTKELGDGLMATFPSAGAAIDAAVDLQQQTWLLAREEEANLELTVGISIGDLSPRGDGDWIGLPAVEAARLCSAASAGQILATDTALALARRTSDATALGALELKGLDDPVPTSSIGWEPVHDESLPAPAALTAALEGPFVGRGDALAELTDAWKRAAAGQGGVVLVAGEPGIGKSRLAAELATRARDAGAVVAYGHCDDSKGLAYEPFVEATRYLLAYSDVDAPPGLERLLPELAKQRASDPMDPELARLQLLDAVKQTLVDTTARSPLVLVLEDLHWANESSLAVLRHVLDGIETSPLLVVATYRSTEVDRRHPLGALLADLRRGAPASRVSLDGLAVDEIEELLEARAGHELDDAGRDFAVDLHAETGGNAFFLREVLTHLVEVGAIERRDGRWSAAHPDQVALPEGVRDVVGRRLSALRPDTNEVLAVAAVVGRTFDVRVLETVLDRDVIPSIEQARLAGLVRESGRVTAFQFTHALVQETLLAELSALRGAKLHAAVSDALASLPHDDDRLLEIAKHAIDGAPFVDLDRLATWVNGAGEQLYFGGASDEAVALGERALDALDDLGFEATPAIADMVSGLSGAQWWDGDRERAQATARRAVEMAEHTGSDEAFVTAVGALGRTVPFGVDAQLSALLPEAVRRAEPGSRPYVHLRGGQLVNGLFFAAGDDIVAAGSELVETVDPTDPDAVYSASFYAAMAASVSPDADYARAVADRSLAEMDQTNSPSPSGMPPLAYIAASWATIRQGDLAETERYLAQLAATQQNPMLVAFAHQVRAILAALRDDLRTARAEIELLRRSVPGDLMFQAGANLADLWVDVIDGDLESAQRALATMTVMPYPRFGPALRAFVHARGGDLATAAEHYAVAVEGGPATLGRDWTYAGTLHLLAELAADLDDADAAVELDAALAPYGDQLLLTLCTHVPASVPFTRGRLALATGDRERGRQLLERALELEAGIGAASLARRTRAELDRMT